jgi:hypothetical protein
MAMAALNQLFVVLASKPEQEKITPEESRAIVSCHFKALWTAGFASGVGGGLTWQVTKKLKKPKGLERVALAAGVAASTFVVAWNWSSSKYAVSSLDHILSQDATRMQKELVNV